MAEAVETRIAFTFLLARKKQTLVAGLGVTFGIGMYIFMNALIGGTNDYFEESMFYSTPHVRIYQDNESNASHVLKTGPDDGSLPLISNPGLVPGENRIRNPWALTKWLEQDSRVVAVSPQVNAGVLFRHGTMERNGSLNGVDILEQDRMFDISSTMLAGSVAELEHSVDGVLLGAGLAQDLDLQIGDFVTVSYAGKGQKQLRVVGVFRTTIKAVDNSKAYAHPQAVQQLLHKDRSYITEIHVNLKDYQTAQEVSKAWERRTGMRVESWQEANEQQIAARMIRDIIANAVVLTILLVAGFGIYNILNMTIYEKIKEIAILKATGFAGPHIVSIFVQQAMLIGTLGGIAGLLFGAGISFAGSYIPIGVGNLATLPIALRIHDYLVGLAFGVGTAFFAGYIPALKASRVDPVSIIRG